MSNQLFNHFAVDLRPWVVYRAGDSSVGINGGIVYDVINNKYFIPTVNNKPLPHRENTESGGLLELSGNESNYVYLKISHASVKSYRCGDAVPINAVSIIVSQEARYKTDTSTFIKLANVIPNGVNQATGQINYDITQFLTSDIFTFIPGTNEIAVTKAGTYAKVLIGFTIINNEDGNLVMLKFYEGLKAKYIISSTELLFAGYIGSAFESSGKYYSYELLTI